MKREYNHALCSSPLAHGIEWGGDVGLIWVVGFNDLLPRFVGVKITHGVEYSCE